MAAASRGVGPRGVGPRDAAAALVEAVARAARGGDVIAACRRPAAEHEVGRDVAKDRVVGRERDGKRGPRVFGRVRREWMITQKKAIFGAKPSS